MGFQSKTCETILDTIGHTPVVALNRVVPQNGVELFAKFEAGNPSFSIKDRIALPMIEKFLEKKKAGPQTVFVTATAGNTGVALSLVCTVKKYRLVVFMPEDASLERRKMFEAFGTTLKVTPKEEGVSGAISRAEDFVKKNKEAYYLNQFDNPENAKAHSQTTAEEILADFPNGVDALVLGVGTGGSLTGVGGVLKKKFPKTKVIAVEPENSAVLSGGKPGLHKIQQVGHGFIPKNLDKSLIDEVVKVKDSEAYLMTRRLSHKEGLLVGISSGANVCAALKVAENLPKGSRVLTFLCDAGQRYFSLEKYFKT